MPFVLFWKICRTFVVIFVFFSTGQLFAQVTLEGKVLERGTRKPLGNINLYILPQGLKATTDEKGNFKFENVPEDQKSWIITATGYKRLKNQVKIFYFEQ